MELVVQAMKHFPHVREILHWGRTHFNRWPGEHLLARGDVWPGRPGLPSSPLDDPSHPHGRPCPSRRSMTSTFRSRARIPSVCTSVRDSDEESSIIDITGLGSSVVIPLARCLSPTTHLKVAYLDISVLPSLHHRRVEPASHPDPLGRSFVGMGNGGGPRRNKPLDHHRGPIWNNLYVRPWDGKRFFGRSLPRSGSRSRRSWGRPVGVGVGGGGSRNSTVLGI
jgi:hypothetical protein